MERALTAMLVIALRRLDAYAVSVVVVFLPQPQLMPAGMANVFCLSRLNIAVQRDAP